MNRSKTSMPSLFPIAGLRASQDAPDTGNHPTNGERTLVAHMFDDSSVTHEARRLLRENLRALLDYYAAHPQAERPKSAVELEGLSGVSNSALSRYAPNLGTPTAAANIDHLARIAAAYNIPLWQLLYPSLDPARPPVVRTPEMEAKNRLILEAAMELLHRGGVDVGDIQGDEGPDRGGPNYREVPGERTHRKEKPPKG
jgi:transcriptional regulator with XRE-family HTH domain